MIIQHDTIAAIATAPGQGGVGIVRVSGPKSVRVAESVLGKIPKPREATFLPFKDRDGSIIDQGIAIYFVAPNSFTGEDVLELHGHGGPVVMDILLERILHEGVRLAKPGEFSERAFLNDKLDLAQAEAIADLIDASSRQAARCAMRSLQGEFSNRIQTLLEELIKLRMYVEAAIDFPEEEIDFLADKRVKENLQNTIRKIEAVQQSVKVGTLLQEGMTVVIAGKPNVGKSSLLNALSGRDSAIVTDIAGTTRDVLREHIHIDGMPLHIIDTAGLRETQDLIEQEGMRRAHQAIEKADLLLYVTDATEPADMGELKKIKASLPMLIIKNKIDLMEQAPEIIEDETTTIRLSAKQQVGIDLLTDYLKRFMGYQQTEEGTFIARRRHLDAINRALAHLNQAETQFLAHQAGELLAEDLRQAQHALSEITGEFSSDDLLGEIFSSFCVGK